MNEWEIVMHYINTCKQTTGITINGNPEDLYYDEKGIIMITELEGGLEMKCEHDTYTLSTKRDGRIKTWKDKGYNNSVLPKGV